MADKEIKDYDIMFIDLEDIKSDKILKNIIRKQQKEIERLEARKYMLNAETGEISQIPIDNNYIRKDKIKAKIEELKQQMEKEEKETMGRCITIGKSETILILQSLLEKEQL